MPRLVIPLCLATDAICHKGKDLEPRERNFFAALHAKAITALLDAIKRGGIVSASAASR